MATAAKTAITPGMMVIRKTDWHRGKKGPLGTVVSIHQPSRANWTHTWKGPKARVQWSRHQVGVRMSNGRGNTTLISCDALQPVEVALKEAH